MLGRYLRLYAAFARFSLQGEMAFRANYVMKVTVELLWLVLLILFYRTVFAQTKAIAGWTEAEYFFFVGCYFTLEGAMEALFLSNCSEFSELVRNGNLDLVLLQPIDEQFLVSFKNLEWSSVPNVVLGTGIMGYALWLLHWPFDAIRLATFGVTFFCALSMTYSFLLVLATTSVWLVKNQSLFELYWMFTSLMRYPREIFSGRLASPVGWFFTFVIPVLLVVNVPASAMVKLLDPGLTAIMVVAAVAMLLVARWLFQRALRSYRSASS